MTLWVDVALGLLAAGLWVPALVVFAECVAALLPPKRFPSGTRLPGRVDVVVPAHNEEASIASALASLLPQLGASGRLWVIADNCTDETANVAGELGARVISRNDPTRVGKGYALDFAFRHLSDDPPDVVVVIDADCEADPGLIDAIAGLAHASGRPVQSRNLLWAQGANPIQQLSLFAFTVKGFVRQRGLMRLGSSCHLQGTGMAFPWKLLADVTLASEKTAMDTRLTIDLALAGHDTIHFEPLGVRSSLLPLDSAAESQQRRWEHGHLETAIRHGPRLFRAAVMQHRIGLFLLGLDLCVPPIALWTWLWFSGIVFASIAAAAWGSFFALSTLATAGLVVAGALFLAWARFGRDLLSIRVLLKVPAYLLGKLPLYVAFFRRRGNRWAPPSDSGRREN